MGNNWFVLVFNVYINNKRAEIAAKGNNALFTHLLFVAQLLRWSSDSTKLSVSSNAITVENFLEFAIISTQRNSACGKKRAGWETKPANLLPFTLKEISPTLEQALLVTFWVDSLLEQIISSLALVSAMPNYRADKHRKRKHPPLLN